MARDLTILNVCRTCEETSNLTLVDTVPYLHQMLKVFLNLQPLPQQEVMCSNCIKIIQDFKKFELQSLEVDARLRERLQECQQTEPSEVVTMDEVEDRLSLNDSEDEENQPEIYYAYDEHYTLQEYKEEKQDEEGGEIISSDCGAYAFIDPSTMANEEEAQMEEPSTTTADLLDEEPPRKARKKKQLSPEFVEVVEDSFMCEICKKDLAKSLIKMHVKLQ